MNLSRLPRPSPRIFQLLLPLAFSFLFVACRPSHSPQTSDGPTRIVVQLDWFPEPQHGGLYQALALGYFDEAGLEVELVPGGPGSAVFPQLASGRAHLAQADSTTTLTAIARDLPLLNVAAVFQNDPSSFLLHADSPVRDFPDLDGRTIMARPGWPFLDFIQRKYDVSFNVIPFNFSITNFIANPDFIQQGYPIAEPYHIMKGGAKEPRYLFAWDAGFDAYAVLVANRDWAHQNPDALRRFLDAYIRGWHAYLHDDPAPAHALIQAAHPANTDEFLAFSRRMIIETRLVVGRDSPDASQIGQITPERFANQIRQLESLGLLPPGQLTPDDVMTTAYLPSP